MSSEVDAIGAVVALAVVAPAAIALGTGFLAWQGGKLVIDSVNRSVDAQKQREAQKKQMAEIKHRKLVSMCEGVLTEIESARVDVSDFADVERLKAELRDIMNSKLPEDAGQIEGINIAGFSKLNDIIARQKNLAEIKISSGDGDGYEKYSLADLMEDFKIAVMAATIKDTLGTNIAAADPAVLERAKLNEKYIDIVVDVMMALEHVSVLAQDYGMLESSSKFFHSCFNGIEDTIKKLSDPSTSNEELKKGIKRLEGIMDQYETMIPTIDKTCAELKALYQIYVEASNGLGEKAEKRKAFKSIKELEERLEQLKERSKRAKECNEIYQTLGEKAYISYAWDQELKALGYSVHSRQDIVDMANVKPKYAKVGDQKIPFYTWKEKDLTQLYSVADECDLQVVVHEDGTVTMQTMTNGDLSEAAIKTEESHCSKLKNLHANLKKNWFLSYDFAETETSDKVISVAEWLSNGDHTWKTVPAASTDEMIVEQRQETQTNSQVMRNKM